MGELNSLNEKRRKRIDVSKYFGENSYIIIKKLNRLVLNEISLLQNDTGIMKMAMSIFKLDAELSEDEKKKKAIEYFSELSPDERQRSSDSSLKIEKLYIDNGIEPQSHNITENGKVIELNYELLSDYSEAIDFLLNEIKLFQDESIVLGEQNSNK